MAKQTYVERALFIIGGADAGKTTHLLSMLRDRRLGTKGKIPDLRKTDHLYAISNERWLYLRRPSPHESGQTLEDFLDLCGRKMRHRRPDFACRWNFAGALWPQPEDKMTAKCSEIIEKFASRFEPERMRAVILFPNNSTKQDAQMTADDVEGLRTSLHKIKRLQVVTVDSTQQSPTKTIRNPIGLMYADFFDFT